MLQLQTTNTLILKSDRPCIYPYTSLSIFLIDGQDDRFSKHITQKLTSNPLELFPAYYTGFKVFS